MKGHVDHINRKRSIIWQRMLHPLPSPHLTGSHFSANTLSFFSYLQNLVYILESVFCRECSFCRRWFTNLFTRLFFVSDFPLFLSCFSSSQAPLILRHSLLASPSFSQPLCHFPLNSFLLFMFHFYGIDVHCFVSVCCE